MMYSVFRMMTSVFGSQYASNKMKVDVLYFDGVFGSWDSIFGIWTGVFGILESVCHGCLAMSVVRNNIKVNVSLRR